MQHSYKIILILLAYCVGVVVLSLLDEFVFTNDPGNKKSRLFWEYGLGVILIFCYPFVSLTLIIYSQFTFHRKIIKTLEKSKIRIGTGLFVGSLVFVWGLVSISESIIGFLFPYIWLPIILIGSGMMLIVMSLLSLNLTKPHYLR